MRISRIWLQSRLLFATFGVAIVAVALLVGFWPREVITQKNFAKIQIGMSQDELCRLLGTPEYQTVETGLVNGPNCYSINAHQSAEEARRRGYGQYRRQHWS
jgi:hypothetical protein